MSGTTLAHLARRLLAAAAVASLLAPTPAAAGPARERLDRALKSLSDARATFTQTRNSATLGASLKPTNGTLEYRTPRLLRLAFTGAVATNVLVRGDTAWIEQPSAGQVIRTSARASGAPPLPFLEESVAVIERTYVLKESGASRLVLEPRSKGGAVRAIELTLDSKSGLPKRVVVRQGDDESIDFVFARWTVNAGIAASRFAPVFAPGVKLVEL